MRETVGNRSTARAFVSNRRTAGSALSNRNLSYATLYSSNYSPNRNLVQNRSGQKMGKVSTFLTFALIAAAFGLLYVSTGTRGTTYDYKYAELNQQYEELEAKKEDLAVQNARLSSIASAQNSNVAMSMEDAGSASTYTE